MLRADYPGRWGENIGCFPGCGGAAANVTKSFLASADHRSNIMSDTYRRFGVGVSCNQRYLFVAVQFSGSSAADASAVPFRWDGDLDRRRSRAGLARWSCSSSAS